MTIKGRPDEPVQVVKLDAEQAAKKGDAFVLADDPLVRIDARAHKMSKSRGNRGQSRYCRREPWPTAAALRDVHGTARSGQAVEHEEVEGVYRFLNRAWRMIVDVDSDAEEPRPDPKVVDVTPSVEQARTVARTVAAVTDDLDHMRFNTAISRLMEFTNAFTADDLRPRSAMEAFTLLLAPWPPHQRKSSGRSSAT